MLFFYFWRDLKEFFNNVCLKRIKSAHLSESDFNFLKSHISISAQKTHKLQNKVEFFCINASNSTLCNIYIWHNTLRAFQDRENPLDNVLLYSVRRAGSVEMLDNSGDEDDRRTSRKSSPHDASHRSILTSFCSRPLAPSSSLFFSKLPHRLLTSIHPLLHFLLHPAHLYFHTTSMANNTPISPVSPPPSPGPPAFHPHHHPLSSALLACSRTPRTDFLLLFLLLLLSSPCSPSLVFQPGEHGEEESEDPAEEADPKETSSAGAAGERAD